MFVFEVTASSHNPDFAYAYTGRKDRVAAQDLIFFF